MMTSELITAIFSGFSVDGKNIPVKFLQYKGHGEPYVVWMQEDIANTYSGDDELLGVVEYYDFDIYSKGNYEKIIEKLKEILKNNGFVWQPSKTSQDFFETDTGYYHKTLNFGYMKGEENEWLKSV